MHSLAVCNLPGWKFPRGPLASAKGAPRSRYMDVHQLELFLAVRDSPSMTPAALRLAGHSKEVVRINGPHPAAF
jgi:hypothetical protein